MDTQILKHGAPVRLFPVLPEAKKEQRTLSIVLANMTSVRPFARGVLSQLGIKVGKRTSIKCFTEVTLTNEVKGVKDRPDALLVVETGKNSWSALIEAKVGKNHVELDQLDRYLDLAKANNNDAVITITNELTPDPSINPTLPSRSLSKKLKLYHLSWSSILTTAFLLASEKDDPFENDDEVFLISELIRYLEHEGSGRMALDQMNKDWPKIVSDVYAGHPINAKSPEIAEMIIIWHQEARDVALIMTRELREPVSAMVARSNVKDRAGWIEQDSKSFCATKTLNFELDVPNAASRIWIEADFRRRAIKASMRLNAATNRKTNSARLNWLLKQLQGSDIKNIIVTCVTHGRSQNFGAMADEIDPNSDEIKNLNEIVSFQIEMSADLGKHFNSRKKFIEALESHVPYFYKNVGERLKAFVPPPPRLKPKAPDEEAEVAVGDFSNENASRESSSANSDGTAKTVDNSERPAWAIHWQSPSSNM